MAGDEDPQEWELDQLEKLENAAKTYGWKHSSHQYKARLQLIQAQTLQRMQRALGDAPAPVRGQGRKPSRLLTSREMMSSRMGRSRMGSNRVRKRRCQQHSVAVSVGRRRVGRGQQRSY